MRAGSDSPLRLLGICHPYYFLKYLIIVGAAVFLVTAHPLWCTVCRSAVHVWLVIIVFSAVLEALYRHQDKPLVVVNELDMVDTISYYDKVFRG